MKEARPAPKEYTLYDAIMYIFRKWKLIYSHKKQSKGYLGWENGKGPEGEIYEGAQETFGDDMFTILITMSELFTLNIWSSLYVHYTSIQLL